MNKKKQHNFFKLKKEVCHKILSEISTQMNLKLEDFTKMNFVDEKNLMIKGNKKIPLYNHSPTFRENILFYLNEIFIMKYRLKRKEKVFTIIQNVKKKFSPFENENLGKLNHFFLKNSKLKLPWSDRELK